MSENTPVTPLREVPRTPEHCEQPMRETFVSGPLGRVKGFECAKCHATILGPSIREPKPYRAYNPEAKS